MYIYIVYGVLKQKNVYSKNLLPSVNFKKSLYIDNISCGFS